MEQYNVTGMSCAACSARVEKAVSKVPGVTSLFSQSSDELDGRGRDSFGSRILSGQSRHAGYGASEKGRRQRRRQAAAPRYEEYAQETEKHRF